MSFTVKIPEKVLLVKGEEVAELQKWHDVPKNHNINNPHNLKAKATIVYPFCANEFDVNRYGKYKNNSRSCVAIDNKPMSIELVGSNLVKLKNSKRSEIQVRFLNKFITTISNDIIVNSLLEKGLSGDGKIPGKFYFATINRKTKLIQKGSGLENIILAKLNKEQSKKIIEPKSLQVGKVYRTPSGKTAIFLGFVTTETMSYKESFKQGSVKDRVKAGLSAEFAPVVKFHPSKFATLWFEVLPLWDFMINLDEITSKHEEILEQHLLDKMHSISFYSLGLFSVKKKYSFVKEIPNIRVNVPDEIVLTLRNAANQKIKNPSKSYWVDIVKASRYAGLANMSLFATGIHRSPLYDRFVKFEK